MNKLEQAWAEKLSLMLLAGEILAWQYQPITLKLADDTRYTPDFMVVFRDRIEFHETKGYMRDDANVKLKTAASLYPWFAFVKITRDKSGFHETEIKEW